MAFLAIKGAMTRSASVGITGDYTVDVTDMNGATHYLVIGISCRDSNGIRRVLNCTTDSYNNYISGVADATATNGHAGLLPYGFDVDDANLLVGGVTYNFTYLSGISVPVTQVYLTIVCFA